MSKVNGYDLSRDWFNWCFENTDKINPNHSALYFFIINHCNKLGWKELFGLPSEMAKEAIGISNYRTYSKTFEDLVSWGFIKVHQRSKNQYTATVIALVKNTIPHTNALDNATQNHVHDHCIDTVSIDKQQTTNNKPQTTNSFLLSEIEISDDCFVFKNEKFLITEEEKKYLEIAKMFQQLFIKNLTNLNAPTTTPERAQYKKWVDPIRLMLTVDKVTIEQLRTAYDYLNSVDGSFWIKNILTTETLRKQITKLITNKNTKENGKQTSGTSGKKTNRFDLNKVIKTYVGDN